MAGAVVEVGERVVVARVGGFDGGVQSARVAFAHAGLSLCLFADARCPVPDACVRAFEHRAWLELRQHAHAMGGEDDAELDIARGAGQRLREGGGGEVVEGGGEFVEQDDGSAMVLGAGDEFGEVEAVLLAGGELVRGEGEAVGLGEAEAGEVGEDLVGGPVGSAAGEARGGGDGGARMRGGL